MSVALLNWKKEVEISDELVAAYEQHNGASPGFVLWLEHWRRALQTAIRANAHGLMARAAPHFVVPAEWPRLATLALYIRPLTSASEEGGGGGGEGGTYDVELWSESCRV